VCLLRMAGRLYGDVVLVETGRCPVYGGGKRTFDWRQGEASAAHLDGEYKGTNCAYCAHTLSAALRGQGGRRYTIRRTLEHKTSRLQAAPTHFRGPGRAEFLLGQRRVRLLGL
jgi:hypothetical protein